MFVVLGWLGIHSIDFSTHRPVVPCLPLWLSLSLLCELLWAVTSYSYRIDSKDVPAGKNFRIAGSDLCLRRREESTGELPKMRALDSLSACFHCASLPLSRAETFLGMCSCTSLEITQPVRLLVQGGQGEMEDFSSDLARRQGSGIPPWNSSSSC